MTVLETRKFHNAGELINALLELVNCAPHPHTANEVQIEIREASGRLAWVASAGQAQLIEETLTDQSTVYNIRIQ